jgi:hypothetical protein
MITLLWQLYDITLVPNRREDTLVGTLILYAALGLMSLPPHMTGAESCSQYANAYYCDNGISYSQYGDTLYDTRGNAWSQYNNATYGSDESSYSVYGNTLYDNQGNSWSRYGNTIYTPDGRGCSPYANTVYCQ